MNAPADPVLVIDDLQVCVRGGGPVVDGVSLQIPPGEILGLVGESGSGKTTTALAALGYVRRGLRVTSGRVSVAGGADLLAANPRQLREFRQNLISYVPQDPYSALNPTMNVASQLNSAIHRIGSKPTAEQLAARCTELMEAVGLPSSQTFLHRYPHQLSGGQRQRLTIAMAFAGSPRVIVLDEPTTGLDVTTQSLVLSMVSRLSVDRGVAALYVTHDLAVIHEVATLLAVMYAGSIVEQGRTEDVIRTPCHPYTRALIEAMPTINGRRVLQGIPGQAARPRQTPGCSFADRCTWAIAKCQTTTPALHVLPGASRVVACHRAEEVRTDHSPTRTLQPDRDAGASASNAAAVLSVDIAEASYGPATVLSKVRLSLDASECLAVVGESGSGKTTLARCIAGLHSDYQGAVFLNGARLATVASHRQAAERLAVQYIFQNPYNSLNPRKTIRQILRQPLRLLPPGHASRKPDRLAAALSEVSLPADLLARYPDELSGGQRQRVALARALMAEPSVLICDEVTSALDVSVQAVVIEMLRSLQISRGLALLFITHDLALARSISDRIIVVHDGSIVEVGSSEEIVSNPQADYTRQLISNVPSIPEAFHS